MSMLTHVVGACLATLVLAVAGSPVDSDAATKKPAAKKKAKKKKKWANPSPTRAILTVGNNWDGTADLVDPVTFKRLARLNIVPDKDQRMAEILMNPVDLGYFVAIRELVG